MKEMVKRRKKVNKIKKIFIFIVAFVFLAFLSFSPLEVYADKDYYDENGNKLNLGYVVLDGVDSSDVDVSDAWQKMKNAAIVKLITRKFLQCIEKGGTISISNIGPLGSAVWNDILATRRTHKDGTTIENDGALDTGRVFVGADHIFQGGRDLEAGRWLGSMFDDGNGLIECDDGAESNGNLFDMFVYIYKNYRSGVEETELRDSAAHVDENDRMKILCDKDDPKKNGLFFTPDKVETTGWYITNFEYSSYGKNKACNDPNAEYFSGALMEDQLLYMKKVYEDMLNNAGNEFMDKWDNLIKGWDHVTSFYLYYKDFEIQCSGADFSLTKGSDSSDWVIGYQIDDENGTLKKGFYSLSSSEGSSDYSFDGNSYTCKELLQKMNGIATVYLKYVNHAIYNYCKNAIAPVIDDKLKEIEVKYLKNTNASTDDVDKANNVKKLFEDIKDKNGYTMNSETEEIFEPKKEDKDSMPNDYLLTCRDNIPYVTVEMQSEADLGDALEDEFNDGCYDAIESLSWIVCPVLKAISNAADALSETVGGFFE